MWKIIKLMCVPVQEDPEKFLVTSIHWGLELTKDDKPYKTEGFYLVTEPLYCTRNNIEYNTNTEAILEWLQTRPVSADENFKQYTERTLLEQANP
jgi:hypothetical protein